MLLSLLFVLVTALSGLGILTLLAPRDLRGTATLLSAPAMGLAFGMVLAMWCTWGKLPPLVTGLLLLATAAVGALLVPRHLAAVAPSASQRERRLLAVGMLATVVLAAALASLPFGDLPVPLSTHDAAFHVETIQSARNGQFAWSWYPPGLHLLFAAWLSLLPAVDSASGAFSLSFGLSTVAILTLASLAYALWRSEWATVATALLAALTYHFPYSAQVWGGWPLMASLCLVFLLWTLALDYVRAPNAGLSVALAIPVAGIVLSHGTELYTAALGLIAIALAAYRGLGRFSFWWPVPLAVFLAVVLAGPYVPIVMGWATAGGSGSVATGEIDTRAAAQTAQGLSGPLPLLASWLTSGVLGAGPVDILLRPLLIVVAVVASRKRDGGAWLLPLAVIFVGLALFLGDPDSSWARPLANATFPWSQDYRLLMAPAGLWSILAGFGLYVAARFVQQLPVRAPTRFGPGHQANQRRAWIALVAGLLLSTEIASVVIVRTSVAWVGRVATWSNDDQQALNWLRDHAAPGDLVANDGSADAGIWAPYRANVQLLAPRAKAGLRDPATELLLANIGNLQASPSLQAASCSKNLRWIYVGAKGTIYEERSFPDIGVLRTSSALQEVFSSGDASIFSVRLPCDGSVVR